MLAEVHSIDDAKQLINLAEAARVYAKQVELGLEAQNHAGEIKVRAQRRAGEILDKMEMSSGGRPPEKTGNSHVPVSEKPETLEQMGITKNQSSHWQTIAKLPAERFDEYIEKTKTEGGEVTTGGLLNYAKGTNGMKPKQNYTSGIYTPQGMDACQTPPYALDPILPYLDQSWTLWEPAAGELYLVNALYDAGFHQEQVIASDIMTAQNFFDYVPDEDWDCLVTNPPFGIKYEWMERCYEFDKPFALLLPLETLGAKAAQTLFKRFGVEIVLMDKRVDFKMPDKGWDSSAQFPTAWFTWGLEIGSQLTFSTINKDWKE